MSSVVLVPLLLGEEAMVMRTHAVGNENISHQRPIIANDPRSAPPAESPKESRAAIKPVARIRAMAPPPYPAANPIDDKVSAARP